MLLKGHSVRVRTEKSPVDHAKCSFSSPSHCVSAPKRPSRHPPGKAGWKRAWGTGHGGEACPQGPGHCHHPEPELRGWRNPGDRDGDSQPGGVPIPPSAYPPPASSPGASLTLSTQHPHPSLFPPVLGPVVRELGWPKPGSGSY